MRNPKEIAINFENAAKNKATLPLRQMVALAVFAGMYIALAGVGATVGSCTIANPSVAKLVSGCIFSAGLMMVVIAGAELFTGNNLMSIALVRRQISVLSLLRNWVVVYLGNAVGGIAVAAMIVYGHTPGIIDSKLSASIVGIATAKAGLSFGDAFLRGVLCNFLVCVAVWMAASSKKVSGKIACIFMPIMLFVMCGYEHCVANLYYLPAGLFTASEYGIAAKSLTIAGCLHNIAAVTLGNIVGGAVFVGLGYWLALYPSLHPVQQK